MRVLKFIVHGEVKITDKASIKAVLDKIHKEMNHDDIANWDTTVGDESVGINGARAIGVQVDDFRKNFVSSIEKVVKE